MNDDFKKIVDDFCKIIKGKEGLLNLTEEQINTTINDVELEIDNIFSELYKKLDNGEMSEDECFNAARKEKERLVKETRDKLQKIVDDSLVKFSTNN